MDGELQRCDLPKELLTKITKLVDTRTDILRVRAVFSSWRSSVTQKEAPLPLKLPFPIAPDPELTPNCRGCFSLSISTIYRFESPAETPNLSSSNAPSKARLVRVEEPKQGKLRLLNPITKATVKNLPETFPKVLNLLDYRVSELGKAYSLRYLHHRNRPCSDFDSGELSYNLVHKVAVSPTTSDDYAIMAINVAGNLGIFKSGDVRWTAIDVPELSLFDDVVYREGKSYAVDFRGRTVAIDSSLGVTKVAPSLHSGQCKHLVSASADLLLVARQVGPDTEFVYDCEMGEYAMQLIDPEYPIVF